MMNFLFVVSPARWSGGVKKNLHNGLSSGHVCGIQTMTGTTVCIHFQLLSSSALIFIHDGTQVSAFQPPIANRASMHACTCQLVGTELSVSSITTSSLNGYTNCTSEYRFARSSLSRCISIRNGQREVSLDAPSPAAEAAL